MLLTTEAVLALAPDAASAKAAHGLVRPSQWPTLGANDAAVWGECQGSGAKPYQTQVDLAGPAFRCSCPSRKFPCKHGLALLLMRAQHAAEFASGDAPGWVAEWLASRSEKAEKHAEKQAAKVADAPPADPAAGDKREAQRWQRIEAAAQDLRRWLADQIARGLGAGLLKRAAELVESGVQFVALLALSDEGAPSYDHGLAAKLAALGVPSFACTPDAVPGLMAAAIRRDDIAVWAAGQGMVTPQIAR